MSEPAAAAPLAARLCRVALIAGEASGDQLGASLIAALRGRHPGVEFIGMTGPRMRAAGCQSLADIEELSVMGLVEVLRHYPRLRALRGRLSQTLLAARPDVIVGIDVPDFSLQIEEDLKRAGALAVHYVCPQVWAWRAGRLPRIARAVDLVLTLFPFEAPFLAAHGIAAAFVGHPLADKIPAVANRQACRAALGLSAAGPLVALMPGSRRQELRRHVDLFLLAAQRLLARHPSAQFVSGAIGPAAAAQLRERQASLVPQLPLTIIEGRASEMLQAADVALLVSGTVTLEAALSGTPSVVAYRLAPLSYWWLRRLVKVPHIALPNLLLERRWFPEFIQAQASPEALAEALSGWLSNPEAVAQCRAACGGLHAALRQDAGLAAARAIEGALLARAAGHPP